LREEVGDTVVRQVIQANACPLDPPAQLSRELQLQRRRAWGITAGHEPCGSLPACTASGPLNRTRNGSFIFCLLARSGTNEQTAFRDRRDYAACSGSDSPVGQHAPPGRGMRAPHNLQRRVIRDIDHRADPAGRLRERAGEPSGMTRKMKRRTARDRRNRRSLNGTIVLHVPADAVKAKSAPYLSRGKPARRNPMINEDDYSIVGRFGTEYRGIVQY
jgi:hypothetical protein